MVDVITTDLVRLDADLGTDKLDVIRRLAEVVGDAGRTQGPDGVGQLTADAHAREATSPTGLKDGIAIPHCRTTAVAEPTLVFARLSPPVDFGAKDGGADICFLIAAPEGGGNAHLQLLTKLARALVKPEFKTALREAGSADEVVATVLAVVQPAEEKTPAAQPVAAGATGDGPGATAPTAVRRLVAVTACPTGIAHTYMAAEALEAAAGRAGVEITVETQGSAGSTPLPAATIAAADAVIFAVDVGVRDKGRFAGKPLVSTGVKGPIDDGDAVIAKALRAADDPGAPRVEGGGAGESGESEDRGKESFGGTVRRVLMTGVSYMIPFVAAGGLLIALGFLLAGYEIALGYADGRPDSVSQDLVLNSSFANLPNLADYDLANGASFPNGALLTYVGALLFVLGGAAFGFLVPALAGYIAYAIADRPGLAPGFVMGAVAGLTGTGFIGGIIGGVLAGVIALWISRWKVPSWFRALMPVLVIPLLATLLTGLIVIVVLGRPLTLLTESLTNGLNSLGENPGLAIVLGVVLGLMMAFDMGGPLNKTAYAFATTGLGAAATSTDAPELRVMAAVMLAGMVPPLAMSLATFVRPRLFSEQERENGIAAGFMGASFVTEGAIPFAAADPLRVIPAIMLGSAVTGGLSQALDVTLRAPHGGLFVFFAVGNLGGFMIALVAGTLVATAAVVGLKSMARTPVVTPVA